MMRASWRLVPTLTACFVTVGLQLASPTDVTADSIFVPGASQVRVDFSAVLVYQFGTVPDVLQGADLIGYLVYDTLHPIDVGRYPLVDLHIAVGSITFTFADVLEGIASEYAGTFGFDVQALLRQQPQLSEWNDIDFEIFREFGEATLTLRSDNGAVGGRPVLEFSDASTVPEPTMLSLAVVGFGVLTASARRCHRHPGASPRRASSGAHVSHA